MAHSAGALDVDASHDNISPQNQTQTARQASKQQTQTQTQTRHRASVACASCRDRRIRCVVPKNQTECVACSKSGAECIIKNDDERRRPISKAYMSSLSDRISMLEGMLLEKGVVPPPATHPPKTRHEYQDNATTAAANPDTSTKSDTKSPGSEDRSPESHNDDFTMTESEHGPGNSNEKQHPHSRSNEDSPFRILDPKQEDIVHRLLSTKGNLSFDQISGRLRFFGPTANSHVYAESSGLSDTHEPPEQVRRAERIIHSLGPETHDYLMDGFFQYYNSVIQIIDRAAFEADRISKSSKFYSCFLHITMLATGYRGADMDRDDMRKITLTPRESLLHREAKHMLDIELERPGGIPSVQALLLLGDLECGVGRDNTGWMYSGMANRLAFDIGLHLDCTNNMSEQDTKIRNMAMQACVIFDRYWGLFLGRPLAIKSQDVDLLSNRFSMLTSFGLDAPKSDLTTEIYEQLIELMELAGRIVEIRDLSGSNKAVEQKPTFSTNEAEENRRLPERMAWKPSNVKTAPYSFFLLHQQYHVTMILLHRPWAKYGSITGDNASHEGDGVAGAGSPGHDLGHTTEGHSISTDDPRRAVHGSRTSLARSICTQQAIRVARIFWQHRQRFDGRKIFITGIQHAGTASIALIAALAYQHNEPNRQTYIGYLEILSDALSDMSPTYHPSSRMHDLLKAVLEQFQSSMGESSRSRSGSMGRQPVNEGPNSMRSVVSFDSNSSTPVIPVRREADTDLSQPHKKRRPSLSRQMSDFTSSKPPFLGVPSQSAPPLSDKPYDLPYGQQSQPPLDSILFPMGMPGQPIQLGLGLMGGNAINVHHAEIGSGHMIGEMGNGSISNPMPDSWNLPHMQQQQPFMPGHFNGAIDGTSGTAGLSASSVLNQSAAMSSGIMSAMPAFGQSKEAARFGTNEKSLDGQVPNKFPNIESNWAEGSVGAMSSERMSEYAQNMSKTSRIDGSNDDPRNYTLDFFNFT
ncbi:hypothetical protein F66182_8741 [Fusarium sp. NRRL 66182]|nr:hypothetical protein F66182_8741 [Fusarium sp. NRRL 66182]